MHMLGVHGQADGVHAGDGDEVGGGFGEDRLVVRRGFDGELAAAVGLDEEGGDAQALGLGGHGVHDVGGHAHGLLHGGGGHQHDLAVAVQEPGQLVPIRQGVADGQMAGGLEDLGGEDAGGGGGDGPLAARHHFVRGPEHAAGLASAAHEGDDVRVGGVEGEAEGVCEMHGAFIL